MANINFEVTYQATGKVRGIARSIHQAKKIYLALRKWVGDIQYQAKSGEWITLATIKIALELQGAA